tara:strand:+ start:315 stop:689 length:375 start_codon:yes stop_codon:yes gene_type:complete
MKKYLAFNPDGTLYQECTVSVLPDDDMIYIDASTVDPYPDIFSKICTLVNGEVITEDFPEVVLPDRILLRDVRSERTRLLKESDWTQVPDSPANTSEWATYRQALRDITDGIDLQNVTWPTPPE